MFAKGLIAATVIGMGIAGGTQQARADSATYYTPGYGQAYPAPAYSPSYAAPAYRQQCAPTAPVYVPAPPVCVPPPPVVIYRPAPPVYCYPPVRVYRPYERHPHVSVHFGWGRW